MLKRETQSVQLSLISSWVANRNLKRVFTLSPIRFNSGFLFLFSINATQLQILLLVHRLFFSFKFVNASENTPNWRNAALKCYLQFQFIRTEDFI